MVGRRSTIRITHTPPLTYQQKFDRQSRYSHSPTNQQKLEAKPANRVT
jgi:hypothetical protein